MTTEDKDQETLERVGADIPWDKKKSPRGRGPDDRSICARNSNESRNPAPAALVDLKAEALAAMQAAGLPFESLEVNSGWQRAPGQDHYWYIADSGIGRSGRPWLQVSAGDARITGGVDEATFTWKSWTDGNAPLNRVDLEEVKRQLEAAAQEREVERVQARKEAAEKADGVWAKATPETNGHPDLQDKQVHAHGLRRVGNHLLVPVADTHGKLHGLQSIRADGTKRFNPDAAVAGHFHLLGSIGKRLYLAEGYATAATIHEATGEATACCFNAGNLKPVAEVLRQAHPGVELVICSDNDQWTQGNPGLSKAREAAAAVGGSLVVPTFADTSSRPTDFNDLQKLRGLEEVKQQLAETQPVEMAEEDVVILDDAPPTINRLLSLVNGHAYAVTWVFVQKLVRERKDKDGNTIAVDPPREEVHLERVIVRNDGKIYSNAPIPGTEPLSKLPVEFHGQEIPPEHLRWSGAGVNRFRDGERPDAVSAFSALCAVVRHYMDFSGSFTEEDNLQELVAIWALNTYLLDAYPVVGYLWPNGEAGSGKSHLLHTLSAVSYLGFVILASGSFASIRDLAGYGATLLFDDAEKIMDPRSGDPDKQALLLAGNRKGTTVPIKVPDPANARKWITRHINAYCPRAFSAIGLPIDTMASRTIFVLLLASANSGKANSDPLDFDAWPKGIDRRRLVDDLWALALMHLPTLPSYDKQAVLMAKLSGRALQPWRAILATALWLEEKGVEGLYGRMAQVIEDYRSDNLLASMTGHRTIVVRALRRLADRQRHSDPTREVFQFQTTDLWHVINEVARDDGEEPGEEGYISTKSLGWRLRRLRLRRPEGRSSSGKEWIVTEAELGRLEVGLGLIPMVSDKTALTAQTAQTALEPLSRAPGSAVSAVSAVCAVSPESAVSPDDEASHGEDGGWTYF